MLYRTLAVFAIGAAAFAGMNAPPQASPPGFLGRPLSEVLQSGFFRWFNLEKTGERSAPGGAQVISYRPSGERFHNLALVEATVQPGPAHSILRIDLVLARSFIDSPSDGIFATDIASSFLRDAAPASEAAKKLAEEIQAGASTTRPMLVYRQPAPPPPARPGPGLLVYRGKRRAYSAKGNGTVMAIENSRLALRISLAPPSPPRR